MKAKITVNREKVQGEVSPLLFGHFMEHAFGNIYGGVYDPGHPLSDEVSSGLPKPLEAFYPKPALSTYCRFPQAS